MNLREFRRILRQTLLVPIALLLALATFFLLDLERFSSALHALDHSDRVTSQINGLQKFILDQETGMRGYELSSDHAMLVPYKESKVPIQNCFATLRGLLADNSAQERRLSLLSERYQVWLVRSQEMIAGESSLLNDPRIHQQNKLLMDNIREVVNQMLLEEDARRRLLSERAPRIEHGELVSILTAALLIGVILALFTRERLRTVATSYNSALDELGRRSQEVNESRRWFQTTLESIGDAVIACDFGGRIRFLNAVAEELTGWTLHEAHGRLLTEVFNIIHEETRKPSENPVEKVRKLKKVVGLANHTVLISRQGKEHVIDDSAAPIIGESGEMTGIVLVFHDVTEQRRTEAALVTGEKLAVAGRLAASIAHEIHNPLDSVTNLMFLLREEEDAAKRAEYLRLAEQELSRTMQISRAMLSLYRESKSPVALDLKDLIEGVLLLLERRIAQQEVDLKVEFRENCIVEGYPAELRQVFTNVTVNAIDAAGPHGRVCIRLEGAPAEEFRAAGAIIEVMDSGPGVAEKAGTQLFQPFFTTKGEKGTGLGLWVSMGIVQKHGGMMRLENCKENGYGGACAWIYLPARTMMSREKSA
ncbi:MAG TPA: CHASE3 domain-containing protein [Silvibacterium sp.]|nr:CHASE3 domain-containing protein [Silvibacterium sp.]